MKARISMANLATFVLAVWLIEILLFLAISILHAKFFFPPPTLSKALASLEARIIVLQLFLLPLALWALLAMTSLGLSAVVALAFLLSLMPLLAVLGGDVTELVRGVFFNWWGDRHPLERLGGGVFMLISLPAATWIALRLLGDPRG